MLLRSILILFFVASAVFAGEPPASHPHPERVVARKHHSQKLLSEAQLRSKAKQLPAAADKLMGVKADDLMPTWSTTTPPEAKPNSIVAEGKLNLKHQTQVEATAIQDDKHTQSTTSNHY